MMTRGLAFLGAMFLVLSTSAMIAWIGYYEVLYKFLEAAQ